jgi:hypothetical protein
VLRQTGGHDPLARRPDLKPNGPALGSRGPGHVNGRPHPCCKGAAVHETTTAEVGGQTSSGRSGPVGVALGRIILVALFGAAVTQRQNGQAPEGARPFL